MEGRIGRIWALGALRLPVRNMSAIVCVLRRLGLGEMVAAVVREECRLMVERVVRSWLIVVCEFRPGLLGRGNERRVAGEGFAPLIVVDCCHVERV